MGIIEVQALSHKKDVRLDIIGSFKHFSTGGTLYNQYVPALRFTVLQACGGRLAASWFGTYGMCPIRPNLGQVFAVLQLV